MNKIACDAWNPWNQIENHGTMGVCVRVQYAYQSGFEHSCKMNTTIPSGKNHHQKSKIRIQ